MKGVHADRF